MQKITRQHDHIPLQYRRLGRCYDAPGGCSPRLRVGSGHSPPDHRVKIGGGQFDTVCVTAHSLCEHDLVSEIMHLPLFNGCFYRNLHGSTHAGSFMVGFCLGGEFENCEHLASIAAQHPCFAGSGYKPRVTRGAAHRVRCERFDAYFDVVDDPFVAHILTRAITSGMPLPLFEAIRFEHPRGRCHVGLHLVVDVPESQTDAMAEFTAMLAVMLHEGYAERTWGPTQVHNRGDRPPWHRQFVTM